MSPANNTPMPAYGDPKWKILSATPNSGPSPTGGFTKGWDVTYQLSSGSTGQVFVPGDVFNVDAVKAAVMDQAARLHAVLNLTSET